MFCFLKTALIHAFYAGVLPSFAECKQLAEFYCTYNQFTGAYSRVTTDRSVVPDIPAVTFCLLKTDLIRACPISPLADTSAADAVKQALPGCAVQANAALDASLAAAQHDLEQANADLLALRAASCDDISDY